MTEPEPWEIAAAREHGARDHIAMLLLAGVSLAWAIIPPVRLLVLTALRLAMAGLLAALAWIAPDLLAKLLLFGAHAFVVLALLSIAAHIEGATLGPLADWITQRRGRDA